MSGKSLDDYSDAERKAYEQGAADTHERYARQEAQARDWLANTIEVVARIEQHEPMHSYARRVIAVELRRALGLSDVRIACSCDACKARRS